MATSSNAMIKIETSSTAYTAAQMTDQGAHDVFKITDVDEFSGDPDIEVHADGIESGINLLSPYTTNNSVQWPAFTCYISGVPVSVSAGNTTVTRPAADVAKVCSIVVDGTATVAEEAGTDGASATFSETRGAAGGPPFIQVADIEIGQVRLTSSGDALIELSEIKQNPGQHAEFTHFPDIFEISHVGKGDILAETASEKTAYVKFASALPLIHTGSVTKGVYCDYAVPTMTEIPRTLDYTPCENTPSTSSTQYYGGSDASSSTSLGSGSFTARLNDGIRDFIVRRKDKPTVVFFYPDRDKTPHQKTMATIGLQRTFPVADQNQATCTLASLKETADFTS